MEDPIDKPELTELEEVQLAEETAQMAKQQISSEHYELYCQEMEPVRLRCEATQPSFSDNGITYDPNVYQEFDFEIENQLNGHEVVMLKIRIGGFTVPLKILNCDQTSPLLSQQPIGEGYFGKIFQVDFSGENLAVKSVSIPFHLNHKARRKEIIKAVHELCICKISESLGVGPSMPKVLGFDAVLYRTSLEFPMEKCDFLKEYLPEHEQTLLDNLGLLHRHKVMHMDINPNNLMFSPMKNKIVFIDFGLSKIIREDCSFKTFTNFNGTPQYVSKEMLKLLSVDSSGDFIDLYYNDLVCLKNTSKSLSFFFSEEQQKKQLYIQLPSKQSDKKPLEERSEKQLKINHEFVFIYFKHECFFRLEEGVKLFQEYRKVLVSEYPKALLKLFIYFLPSSLVEDLVLLQMRELKHLDEYCQFENRYRYVHECTIPKHIEERETIFTDWWSKIEKSGQDSKETTDEAQQLNKFIVVAKNLKKREYFDFFEDKSEYFSQLFECLRFDRKNLDVKDKIDLSSTFIEFVYAKSQKAEEKSLNQLLPIQKALKHLFSFCLIDSSPLWRNNYWLDILIQSILTEADILEQLAILKNHIESEKSYSQLIALFFQFFKILQFFKLLFLDDEIGVMIEKESEIIFDKVAEKIWNMRSTLNEEQHMEACLAKQLYASIHTKELEIQVMNMLQRIENQQRKVQFQKIIFKIESSPQKLKDFLKFYSSRQLISKDQAITSQLVNKHNLVQKLCWSHWFLEQNAQQSERQILARQLCQIINCQQLFIKFYSFDKSIIEMFRSLDSFKLNFGRVLKTCFKQKRFSKFPGVIGNIIYRLKQYPSFAFQNVDQIQNYYHLSYRYFSELFEEEKQQKLRWFGPPLSQLSQQDWKNYAYLIYLIKHLKLKFEPPITQASKPAANLYWQAMNRYALGNFANEQIRCFRVLQNIVKLDLDVDSHKQLSLIKRQKQMAHNSENISDHWMTINRIVTARDTNDQRLTARNSSQDSIALWHHKYIMLNSLVYPIYLSLQSIHNHLIAQIIFHLFSKSLYSEIYQFIVKLVEELGKHAMPSYIYQFQKAVFAFRNQNPLFFTLEAVRHYFGTVTWKNRFCLVFYFFAIKIIHLMKIESFLKYFKNILAINMHMLPSRIKNKILSEYYTDCLQTINSTRQYQYIVKKAQRFLLQSKSTWDAQHIPITTFSFMKKQIKSKGRKLAEKRQKKIILFGLQRQKKSALKK